MSHVKPSPEEEPPPLLGDQPAAGLGSVEERKDCGWGQLLFCAVM